MGGWYSAPRGRSTLHWPICTDLEDPYAIPELIAASQVVCLFSSRIVACEHRIGSILIFRIRGKVKKYIIVDLGLCVIEEEGVDLHKVNLLSQVPELQTSILICSPPLPTSKPNIVSTQTGESPCG